MVGKFFLLLTVVVLALSLTVGLLFSYLLYTVPPPTLPEEDIKDLAKNYYSFFNCTELGNDGGLDGNDGYVDQPMAGKVVIVTGSTSGIGESLAFQMYKMGATVVVTSRNQSKADQTVIDFNLDFPFSEGVLYSKAMDVSDLSSVRHFASWVSDTFSEVHILVNNAGINYSTQGMFPTPSTPLRSRQGYDLLFATNYLGHFLLTDLLMSLLKSTKGARVLQVGSNAHYLPIGDALDTWGGRVLPLAAEVLPLLSPSSQTLEQTHLEEAQTQTQTQLGNRRRDEAYGLSKLAGVMHAVEVQRRLDTEGADLKIFSFTPGITFTNMVPDHLPPMALALLRRLLYSPSASLLSPLSALFSHDIKGGADFFSNTPQFTHTTALGRWLLSLVQVHSAATPPATLLLLVLSIFHQQYYYGQISDSPVHPACHDEVLTRGLYEWSLSEVHRQAGDEDEQGRRHQYPKQKKKQQQQQEL